MLPPVPGECLSTLCIVVATSYCTPGCNHCTEYLNNCCCCNNYIYNVSKTRVTVANQKCLRRIANTSCCCVVTCLRGIWIVAVKTVTSAFLQDNEGVGNAALGTLLLSSMEMHSRNQQDFHTN